MSINKAIIKIECWYDSDNMATTGMEQIVASCSKEIKALLDEVDPKRESIRIVAHIDVDGKPSITLEDGNCELK